MTRLRCLAAIACVAGALGAGCSGATATPTFESGTVKVAVAFYPIEEIVRAVGGSTVSIVDLVPPGESAHDYEPTSQQITDLQSADIVFYLGSGFQPNVEKAIESLPSRVKRVDLLASVPLIAVDSQLAGADGQTDGAVLGNGKDPHVWLAPANMQLMTSEVQQSLAAISAADAATLASRATAYTAALAKLNAEFSTGLTHCMSDVIVTSHRAFGYLANAYGLRQIAISGISPTEEPSAKTLEAVAQAAKANNVTTIFFEHNLPADLSKTIASEIGAVTAVLDPVESLSKDQLEANANYTSIMHQNLAALTQGLGCS